ncbi:TonB-dependent receptor [Bradyrhizobium sp. LMTR 3]|uniref:TonB-dependent receptor n=1 Tax=Bradyrhizobium sp. LMTR 3 TaxID=189873 RepID=UPI001AECD996|nr:TonB-dependent receptor [Bradyrhizobium sp. LMTR 3]
MDSASLAFAQAPPDSGIVQVQGGDAAAPRNFNIPAQPLGAALNAFGRQSGLQVTLSAATSRGLTSNAVNGSFTPEQALALMLRNTGIVFRVTADRTAIIGTTASPAAEAEVYVPGATQLDPLVISGGRNAISGSGYQGTPDWVYQAPAAVSVISREAIESSPSRNARDLLDNVAGVYANRSEAQNPGISVNIRGLQDQDRIATMIDGARQSFQRSAHGATQRTYVDTAFIRAVDIEKSTTSGVGSAGALGGSVNFRTLLAEDLIAPGKQYGGQVNLTTGTNQFNFDGSTAAAVRLSDRFSVLGGISYKNIGAYDIGKNGTISSAATYAGDVLLFSGQEVRSGILKAEGQVTEDVKVTLGWVRNDSRFNTGNYDGALSTGNLHKATEGVVNNTFTSALDRKPDSDLIDLKARFYYNNLRNNRVEEGSILSTGPSNYVMATLGGSVENTSSFDTALGALALNYGMEAFNDDGKTVLTRGFVAADGTDYSNTLSGGTPSGKRDIISGFGNAKYAPTDWLTVSGGLRYDWYHAAGTATVYGDTTKDIIGYRVIPAVPPTPRVCWPSPPFPPNFRCTEGTPGSPATTEPIYGPEYYKRHNVNVDNSGGALLPSVTIAVKPFEWLQPFVKYSKSYRPPTIMESFLNGGHDGNSVTEYAPNPALRPERGETYEVGANVSSNGILTERDTFRFKAVGFYREIVDYISFGKIRTAQSDVLPYTSYVNLDGVTRMKGIEVEANYDARFIYIGGTITRIDTELADSFTSPAGRRMPINSGQGAAIIFEQPKLRVTLDAGVRLFEERLTLGGRITDVSKTEPALGSLRSGYDMPGYRVYDIYGSYAFDPMTKLRFSVTNLTDVAYAPAVGANFYAAPGRTATVSLNYKF